MTTLMRFRIMGSRTDVATAGQVRAVREARGWTVEQMADAVGGTPLEVSVWESGAVAAPPLQAARVRWMAETDRRNAAALPPCGWVREHAPGLYDEMLAAAAENWYARSQEIRDHYARCSTCQAMWHAVQRMGPPPPEPDESTFHTLRARYERWVQRFPLWARGPLNLLGSLVGMGVIAAAVLTMPDPDSGLAARVTGLGLGALFGFGGFLLTRGMLRTGLRLHPFVSGLAAGAVGISVAMSTWSAFDASVHTGDPRFLAGAAVLSVAAGLWSSRRHEAAETPVAQPAEPPRDSPDATTPHPLPGTRVPGEDEVPLPRADHVRDGARLR